MPPQLRREPAERAAFDAGDNAVATALFDNSYISRALQMTMPLSSHSAAAYGVASALATKTEIILYILIGGGTT